MNSLKNLLIIAVLGLAGYGIYSSLVRSNVDVAQSPQGAGPGWTSGPKVEIPKTPITSAGGTLSLGNKSAQPPSLSTTASATTTPPLLPYKSSDAASSSIAPSAGGMNSPNDPGTTNAIATPGKPDVNNIATPTASQKTYNPIDGVLHNKFTAFMDAVRKKLDEGKLAEAHLALSTLYGNPDLPAEQAKQLSDLLNQLAGTVIYSRKHYLEPAYMTQPGDTLEKIAQQYNVPWHLLARINGLMPPGAGNGDGTVKDQPLPVGMDLKVVRGPFEAVVKLEKHELVLMVQNRYAGKFPIGVGRDTPKLDGSYTVRDKTLNPTYYGPDNVTIDTNDPKNPLGSAWIGLSDRIGIHGTNDPQNIGRDDNRGAICVGPRDLDDLYGILSVGSRVTIVR